MTDFRHDELLLTTPSDLPVSVAKPEVTFKKRGHQRTVNLRAVLSASVATLDDDLSSKDVEDSVDASDDESVSTLHTIMQQQQERQHKTRGIVLSTDGQEEAQKLFNDRETLNQQRNAKIKAKLGGLVTHAELGGLSNSMQSAGNEVDIGTEFSLEQNFGDVEAEMRAFVEEELKKRKGVLDEEAEPTKRLKLQTPEDALLLVAQKYQKFGSRRNEDMISDQMLTGIPEVELGVEAKMKNIESTEKAKKELLRRMREARSAGREYDNEIPSELVPDNMAVNYVQHARYDIQQPWWQKRDVKLPGEPPAGENTDKPDGAPSGGEGSSNNTAAKIGGHATDDIHFDKFRKQLRDRFMSKSSRGARRRRGA